MPLAPWTQPRLRRCCCGPAARQRRAFSGGRSQRQPLSSTTRFGGRAVGNTTIAVGSERVPDGADGWMGWGVAGADPRDRREPWNSEPLGCSAAWVSSGFGGDSCLALSLGMYRADQHLGRIGRQPSERAVSHGSDGDPGRTERGHSMCNSADGDRPHGLARSSVRVSWPFRAFFAVVRSIRRQSIDALRFRLDLDSDFGRVAQER